MPATITLPRRTKPSLACPSKEVGLRPALENAYLREHDGHWEILTSDTYCLARIEVTVVAPTDAMDGIAGPIPVEAMRQIEGGDQYLVVTDKTVEVVAPLDGSKTIYQRPDDKGPTWDKLLAKERSSSCIVSLDPRLLARLAEALGSPDGVTLTLDLSDPLVQIGVGPAPQSGETPPADGLMMPIRLKDHRP